MKYKFYKADIACQDGKMRNVTITTNANNRLTKNVSLTSLMIAYADDEDVFLPMRMLRGKLSIQCNDDDISINDIIPQQNITDSTIEITCGDDVEFVGYISADNFTQPYPINGESIDVQFVSRLGIASDIPFWPLDEVDSSDFKPQTYSFSSLIAYCCILSGYGRGSRLVMPKRISDNLYTSLYPFARYEKANEGATVTGLEYPNKPQSKLSDVLTEIAKFVGCSIIERGKDVYLVSVEDTEYVAADLYDNKSIFVILSFRDTDKPSEQAVTGNVNDGIINYYNGARTVTVSMKQDITNDIFEPDYDMFVVDEEYHRQHPTSFASTHYLPNSIDHLQMFNDVTLMKYKSFLWTDAYEEYLSDKMCAQISIRSSNFYHSYIYNSLLKSPVFPFKAYTYTVSFDLIFTDEVANVDMITSIVFLGGIQRHVQFTSSSPDQPSCKWHGEAIFNYYAMETSLRNMWISIEKAAGVYVSIMYVTDIKIEPKLYSYIGAAHHDDEYVPGKDVGVLSRTSYFQQIGNDYSIDLALTCQYKGMEHMVQNHVYTTEMLPPFTPGNRDYTYNNCVVENSYLGELFDKIARQKGARHQLELTINHQDIALFYIYKGQHYMMTGYQRDYARGVDIVKLTSITI